jgi:hypothetical protein
MADFFDELLDTDDEYEPEEAAAGFPVMPTRNGGLVPDLPAIPEERWIDALRPLDASLRAAAVNLLAEPNRNVPAQLALLRLEGEDLARRQAALEQSGPPDVLPLPRPTYARREVRQVSFRLSLAEHSELERAAYAFGTSSARLARMLTMRGVRRTLRDA